MKSRRTKKKQKLKKNWLKSISNWIHNCNLFISALCFLHGQTESKEEKQKWHTKLQLEINGSLSVCMCMNTFCSLLS